jgi:carboxylesterase type B
MSEAAYTPHVNSTSGLIIGHQAPDSPDTFEFLGIKYGQAPVGELRFAPPEKYTAPSNTVYNASNWVSSTLTASQV